LIRIAKSIYDKPEPSDGTRIFVMRMWPRGVSRDKVDLWLKDLGTPRELIKKWKAGTITWDEYTIEYRESLKGKEKLLRSVAAQSKKSTVSLLCTERDPNRCHRSLLKAAIDELAGGVH